MNKTGYLNNNIIPFPFFIGVIIILICGFGLAGCASNLYIPYPSIALNSIKPLGLLS